MAANASTSPAEQSLEERVIALVGKWDGILATKAAATVEPTEQDFEEVIQGMCSVLGLEAAEVKTLKYTKPDYPHGEQEGDTWRNWGQTFPFRSMPKANEHHPTSTDQVIEIVNRARDKGHRIRCVGHAHSWSPAFMDGEQHTVIFTGGLPIHGQTTRIELDRRADKTSTPPTAARVRVAAGVTTGELADWLEMAANAAQVGDVGLPADVILETVMYGGVVSMGCHGTGLGTRTVCDRITELRVVDGLGQFKTINDDAQLKYARASLGLMGVIIDMVLELDDSLDHPCVTVKHEFPKMQDVFKSKGELAQLVQGAQAFEMFWMPFGSVPITSVALDKWNPDNDPLYLNIFEKRVPKPPNVVRYGHDHDGNLKRAVERLSQGVGKEMSNLACRKFRDGHEEQALAIQLLYGKFAALALPMLKWLDILRPGVQTMLKAIHYKSYIDDFRVYDYEVCFKVDDDFGNVYAAWKGTVKLLHEHIQTKKFNPMNVALEIRFTKGTRDVVLAPSYATDADAEATYAWIEVLGDAQTPLDEWLSFVRKVHDGWQAACGNDAILRPHWAKWHDLVAAADRKQREDWLTPHVRRVYDAQLNEFKHFLQEYPGNHAVFSNEWLDRVFQFIDAP